MKKTISLIDNMSFVSDFNSEKNKKRALQIKKNRERSKSSIDLPTGDEKLKLVEKKQYAESIDNGKNSLLENALNIKATVATADVEDAEVVISDLDANVDENEDSSTPSLHKSSSSGSGSFVPIVNTLQKKNQIKKNRDNLTPSYLLLMQTIDDDDNVDCYVPSNNRLFVK